MPPPKKPRCRDAPWFFLAREGPSARPELARNRRWTMPCNVSVRGAFQLTPSVGRATKNPLSVVYLGCISIHALRGESDPCRYRPERTYRDFNPRPPRGGRRFMFFLHFDSFTFQSTPSARRATDVLEIALHKGVISIHALREEGDDWYNAAQAWSQIFQSTPSARRATEPEKAWEGKPNISIHALREEGDSIFITGCPYMLYFNPRPPRGGRPTRRAKKESQMFISIHALREEGDMRGGIRL